MSKELDHMRAPIEALAAACVRAKAALADLTRQTRDMEALLETEHNRLYEQGSFLPSALYDIEYYGERNRDSFEEAMNAAHCTQEDALSFLTSLEGAK